VEPSVDPAEPAVDPAEPAVDVAEGAADVATEPVVGPPVAAGVLPAAALDPTLLPHALSERPAAVATRARAEIFLRRIGTPARWWRRAVRPG
jgi:hypothetical protein